MDNGQTLNLELKSDKPDELSKAFILHSSFYFAAILKTMRRCAGRPLSLQTSAPLRFSSYEVTNRYEKRVGKMEKRPHNHLFFKGVVVFPFFPFRQPHTIVPREFFRSEARKKQPRDLPAGCREASQECFECKDLSGAKQVPDSVSGRTQSERKLFNVQLFNVALRMGSWR